MLSKKILLAVCIAALLALGCDPTIIQIGLEVALHS